MYHLQALIFNASTCNANALVIGVAKGLLDWPSACKHQGEQTYLNMHAEGKYLVNLLV